MKISKKYLQKLIKTELEKVLIEQVDVSGRNFGPTKQAAQDKAISKAMEKVLNVAGAIQTQAKEYERAVMNLQNIVAGGEDKLGTPLSTNLARIFGKDDAALMQLLAYMEFVE
ncbi:MAG: hypothetical protein CMC15_16040, partial [Flavobacteriaceae bacterium]|nr:hypothetical protein [Flavobacteriaceae bacterium]